MVRGSLPLGFREALDAEGDLEAVELAACGPRRGRDEELVEVRPPEGAGGRRRAAWGEDDEVDVAGLRVDPDDAPGAVDGDPDETVRVDLGAVGAAGPGRRLRPDEAAVGELAVAVVEGVDLAGGRVGEVDGLPGSSSSC